MEQLQTTDLIHMPLLKAMLINYIHLNYEEASDTSDDSLIAEYRWLLKNNQLEHLIEAEYIQSSARYIGG